MKKLVIFAVIISFVFPMFCTIVSRPAEAAFCGYKGMNPRCGYTSDGGAYNGGARGRCPVGTCAKNGTPFFTVSAANCSKANCHRH